RIQNPMTSTRSRARAPRAESCVLIDRDTLALPSKILEVKRRKQQRLGGIKSPADHAPLGVEQRHVFGEKEQRDEQHEQNAGHGAGIIASPREALSKMMQLVEPLGAPDRGQKQRPRWPPERQRDDEHERQKNRTEGHENRLARVARPTG